MVTPQTSCIGDKHASVRPHPCPSVAAYRHCEPDVAQRHAGVMSGGLVVINIVQCRSALIDNAGATAVVLMSRFQCDRLNLPVWFNRCSSATVHLCSALSIPAPQASLAPGQVGSSPGIVNCYGPGEAATPRKLSWRQRLLRRLQRRRSLPSFFYDKSLQARTFWILIRDSTLTGFPCQY